MCPYSTKWRYIVRVINNGVTGGGGGAGGQSVPSPQTSDREISSDITGKRDARKKGKWNRKEEIKTGKVEN